MCQRSSPLYPDSHARCGLAGAGGGRTAGAERHQAQTQRHNWLKVQHRCRQDAALHGGRVQVQGGAAVAVQRAVHVLQCMQPVKSVHVCFSAHAHVGT